MHTRITINCSVLNSDLFVKNTIDSASCTCGAIENAYHVFFSCGRYLIHRNDLLHELNFLPNVSLNILLYGDVLRNIEDNIRIFQAVQKFIEKKKKKKSI